MLGGLKISIKKTFRRFGFDLRKLPGVEYYRFFPRPEDRHKWIQGMGIKTILDVGAHTGESALQFHEIFPQAMIYSFEPLHECFKLLESQLRGNPLHKCFNFAIGDAPGKSIIHRSGYSPSSSLLAMGEVHKRAYPFSAKGTSEPIEVRTLDGLAGDILLEREILLKIDTQGYEKHVLLGASDILKHVKLIILETSFAELYERQPRFPEIYQMLAERGFEYRGSWDQFHNPKDGLPIQQDGIFVNVGL
jgi:FkbM family methyltransferase